MSQILVVGEDALSCALGERLVAEILPKWSLAKPSINTRGITKLIASLQRYGQQATYVQPVLCIADTDGKCPVDLVSSWLPVVNSQRFLFRLAVSEAESWVLSDRQAAADFFGVSVGRVPQEPDHLADPKREVLRLARRSNVRPLRQEIVSATDINKPGTGYNVHLCKFVAEHWRATRAAEQSESLSKAVLRLTEFGEVHGGG